MLFDESGKLYGEVLKLLDEDDGADFVADQDANRAQTAGERVMRSPLKISGKKIARNLISRKEEGSAKHKVASRPVTSPTTLPSWNMSLEEKERAWSKFDMSKMSEATSKAYEALLDDDEEDGALFGEDILPQEDITLVNFEEVSVCEERKRRGRGARSERRII